MKRISLAAALCVLAAPAVQAEGVYVTAALGQSRVDFGENEFNAGLGSLGINVTSSRVDENDTSYGLNLGYAFNPYLALELGYVDLGRVSYRGTSNLGALALDIESHGWSASAVGSLPLNEQFSVFGRVGGVNAKVDVSGPGGALSDRSWGALYGVGLDYAFTPSVGIRAEFTRYDSVGDKNKTGEADVDNWSVGVLYRF
ncbi:outer membrane beta-barrel protein [Methyloversatilis discipulorum]|uniref:outer membrane beta-barrel protein n=1 Tax=Methyloversatilis discipulorum TaxID=1119528 RepID=UPI003AF888CA